jgi:hypothetical protein
MPSSSGSREVNLGHLLTSKALPVPSNNDHVFFCPSGRASDGTQCIEGFIKGWDRDNSIAMISYMYNNALDGFDSSVQDGQVAVLSHNDKINFLRGDGSVDSFNVKRLVFDATAGPERLQEVALRYGVNFPTIMLHRWLARGDVNLDEAREYLSNPQGWANNNCTLENDAMCRAVSKPVLLASVSSESLACDVVGVWGGIPSATPGGRPPSG